MFISETYGKIDLEKIPDCMNEYYGRIKQYGTPIRIIVGTDSQNFSDTKMVSVVAVYCEGHGGIYFYEISRIKKISDVRKKLHTETMESLEIASKIMDILTGDAKYKELFSNTTFSIHVDAGTNPHGKTKELIPELVGWIHACGYDCETKPLSWVASSVTDRISK